MNFDYLLVLRYNINLNKDINRREKTVGIGTEKGITFLLTLLSLLGLSSGISGKNIME